MIKVSDVVDGTQKITIKALVMGPTGSGKTFFAATTPKSYFLITEPGGEDTFLLVPELRNNVVGFDRFIPESAEDTKPMFERLDKCCKDAKVMYEKGEIETLVLDNLTYLADNRWTFINKFQQELSVRTGEPDTQRMYGKLRDWLYDFVLMNLTSFKGNLILTCHEMMEGDEAMAKKVDKTNAIVPNVLGGFRNDVGGLFSYNLYLGKTRGNDGKYHYSARTNLGNSKNAKCRIPNLAEVVENISYQTLTEAIQTALKNGK
jgi:hypothetical protein